MNNITLTRVQMYPLAGRLYRRIIATLLAEGMKQFQTRSSRMLVPTNRDAQRVEVKKYGK